MKSPFKRAQSKTSQFTTEGAKAESWAQNYLERQGLRIVTKNYRTRRGEVDLIMQHGETLVFVEVRLRTHKQFASAAQSIDHRKQQRIISAAQHYLQHQELWENIPCRFDAICLGKDADNSDSYQVEWLQNAFSLS
ncbi:MAG: YraN family protein [Gammaproteobacteria bacterium]|nr:MAG: YraN family protein [Gammaproteobacteria bacterium]